MSQIPKINECLDLKIKFYKDKLDLLGKEYSNTTSTIREIQLVNMMDKFILVIAELNAVSAVVNQV